MTYIQIITAISLFCSDYAVKNKVVMLDSDMKYCKKDIVNCMEEEKQKDKETIKLYELYFKTCILKEISK